MTMHPDIQARLAGLHTEDLVAQATRQRLVRAARPPRRRSLGRLVGWLAHRRPDQVRPAA